MSPDTVEIRLQLTHPAARAPRVVQEGDVAADLHACEAAVVPARGRAIVPTGVALELPPGFRARVHSRSGLAARHGIEAGAGLIDQGFRLPIGVLLHNLSDSDYAVAVGDRIAQLCIERYTHPAFTVVPTIEGTSRTAGWGSSGVS